ncbi:MAG: tRNA (adenosine(37)-N6)-threonylcarbamoyltransferase complex dimerization subunit type 1 TsaB [Desulforhopalus sp.]
MDTATVCSTVAITAGTREDGVVVASVCLTGKVTHSRRLIRAIDLLSREAAIDMQEIAGIAVSLGPGSFTGLRIGMATAKGLAAATGKPLFGVSTLDTLAGQCTESSRLICSVLDARKKEVYSAFYRCNAEGIAQRVGEMAVMGPDRLAAAIEEPVLMVGDGAAAYRDLFTRLLGKQVHFAPSHLHTPSAATLGMIAAEKFIADDSLDIAEAVPIYIRSSDAELNLLKKRQGGKTWAVEQ